MKLVVCISLLFAGSFLFAQTPQQDLPTFDGLYSFGMGAKGLQGSVPLSLKAPVLAEKKEGKVEFAFIIEPDGSVSKVEAIPPDADPILVDAGITAIQQWKFKPKPAEKAQSVHVTITFNWK